MVELTDYMMRVSKDNIPDLIEKSNARAKFVSDIGAYFLIGVFVYSSQGTLGNWYAVRRM